MRKVLRTIVTIVALVVAVGSALVVATSFQQPLRPGLQLTLAMGPETAHAAGGQVGSAAHRLLYQAGINTNLWVEGTSPSDGISLFVAIAGVTGEADATALAARVQEILKPDFPSVRQQEMTYISPKLIPQLRLRRYLGALALVLSGLLAIVVILRRPSLRADQNG
ncbi:MAG TPA: hypothetical protein VGM19_12270 [Armatimonadota bacterium]|jgi:hypothetical protein